MAISSVPNDSVSTQPVESTQRKNTTPLAAQLTYADYQSVFPTSTMSADAAASKPFLSFDSDIYFKNTPNAAVGQSNDTLPTNSTAKDTTATAKDTTATANDTTATAKDTTATTKDPADYNKAISSDIKVLSADEKALKSASTDKNSAAYKADLSKLDSDEQTLKSDVHGFLWSSVAKSNYKDFSATLEAYHPELLSIAKELDKMGLQPEASQTTAYYPLNHYEHDFDKVVSVNPGGGDYSIKPPSGSINDTGLDTASSQFTDTKPGDIGGTGGVTSATVTQVGPASDQTVTYSETGGGTYEKDGKTANYYSDSLWRSDDNSTTAVNAKAVQLNATFQLTASQLANTSEIEKDIVVQKADGTHATIGTQINTKTGEVDFWNSQTGHWVHEGSVTGGKALTADTKYSLQIGATVNDTGNADTSSYTYDYYTLNGKTLDATSNTFNTDKKNWKPGVYVQTQVDEGVEPKGSVAGFTESNEQLWISDT